MSGHSLIRFPYDIWNAEPLQENRGMAVQKTTSYLIAIRRRTTISDISRSRGGACTWNPWCCSRPAYKLHTRRLSPPRWFLPIHFVFSFLAIGYSNPLSSALLQHCQLFYVRCTAMKQFIKPLTVGRHETPAELAGGRASSSGCSSAVRILTDRPYFPVCYRSPA